MLFGGNNNLIDIVLWFVLFTFSITIHEVAHGYAAYKLGDPTAKYQGRLTLNPMAHLDVFGTLLLLVAKIGWAKPVPINPNNFKKPARDMALVSIAGPLSNLLISFFSIFLLLKIGNPLMYHGFISENMYRAIYTVFGSLAALNAALAVFNLVPLPPLDGSKILLAVAPYKWRNFIFSIEQYGIILIYILLSIISPFIFTISQFILDLFIRFFDLLPF